MADIPDRILEKYPHIKNGEILTPDSIDRAAFDYIYDGLFYALEYKEYKSRPVILKILGHGGSFDLAMGIVDAIHGLPESVLAIVTGHAYSAHVDIWLSCHTRQMTPHAILGLHRLSMDVHNANEFELEQELDELRKGNQQLYKMLVEASNQACNLEFWQKKLGQTNDGFFKITRNDAMKYGMLTKIEPAATIPTNQNLPKTFA